MGMYKKLGLILLAVMPLTSYAGFIDNFKFEDDTTNWQYIANFSSGVLIILLFLSVVFLCFTLLKAHRANKELHQIKTNLEARVKERTVTLDESNRLLQRTNQLLEGEINQHKQTSQLLVASEAYIKSILDSMPLTLIGLNRDFEITQWNNHAIESTGVELKNALSKNLWEALPSVAISKDQLQSVFDNDEVMVIKHCQRGQYYFDITVYPLKNDSETGLVVLLDDVTQQSKAENLFIQKDKFSSMGELAAGMAHDINTPLNVINKEISALIDGQAQQAFNDDEILAIRKKIRTSCNQAFAIVNHLLNFSHSDSQHKEVASVPEVIDRSLELARKMFTHIHESDFDRIHVRKNYAPDIKSIPCHASELHLVFISLLRHACYAFGFIDDKSFTPELTIEVSTFYDSLWVKIQHNGLGLSTEEQMTIFEPFYQDKDIFEDGCKLENRLSFPYFIIVDHHGGQMSVTSDVDMGSTFHIQLLLQ